MTNTEHQANEPSLTEFGPYRIIGMNYIGKNENKEIPEFWEHRFLPRMDEVVKPTQNRFAFGVCRCIPGATDGSFEYIAAAETTLDAALPKGMLELTISKCQYAIFAVASLEQLGKAWGDAQAWFGTHPEWENHCGPTGCNCATHPSFELYPPEFDGNGPLYLYFPVRRKQ